MKCEAQALACAPLSSTVRRLEIVDNVIYKLGKISGVLEAFARVNGKTNHGFTFEIEMLESQKSVEHASKDLFEVHYPDVEVELRLLASWKSDVAKCLEGWLFQYQPQFDESGLEVRGGGGSAFSSLKDTDSSFDLSRAGARSDLALALCDDIDSIAQVARVYELHISTQSWYEASWSDFVFEGQKANLFLHLGVSD
jgi:hypothetical protein